MLRFDKTTYLSLLFSSKIARVVNLTTPCGFSKTVFSREWVKPGDF